MFNSISIRHRVSKPLSIFIKLSKNDEDKINEVKKIIDKEFDLSRGIREMLKLNNPIYEITSSYGHFGRKPSTIRNNSNLSNPLFNI